MNLLVASLIVAASLSLVLSREEVHHIHSERGRNVHVHLHEVGNCEDEVHHHHHHDDHKPEVKTPAKPKGKPKRGKKGKKNKMAGDDPEAAMDSKHPAHHEGDDDIHIHIHEAGEACTNHSGHHGEHGGHHGPHRGYHGHHGGPGRHHGGRGAHACAMCARELSHHGRDHPGHHGPHSHEEDGDKHDHSEDYVYAHCDILPNSAVPKKKRSKVTGAVHMRQLIFGGPVEMQIDIQGFNVKKGHETDLRGFHVHEFGDLSNGCQSAGSHFNPYGMDHGAQEDNIRHAGDFGNIDPDENGVVKLERNDTRSTLIGHHNIIGRAIVIHEEGDDMGKGKTEASKKTGDAGGRIACCVIVRAKPHGHWASDVHDHSGDHHHHDHGDH